MAQQVVLESVIRASLNAEGFQAGVKKLTDAGAQAVQSAERIVASQEKISRSTASVGRAIETLQSRLDKTYDAQKRYERAIETINAAAERGRITQERKAQLLELAQKKYLGVAQAAQRAERSVAESSRSMNTLTTVAATATRGLASLVMQFSALAGFGGLASISGILVGAIRQAEQFERLTLRTQAILQATNFTSGQTAQQIREMSQRIASETLASTRSVEEAAQMLMTFRTVQPEFFERTLRAAQDLAAVGFGTLSSAAVQLGKALEDPERGLTALRRSGISFTEAQQEVIRSLVETGRVAEAQRLILEQVERQVGGAGRAEARGLAGAFDTLSQNVEKFLSRIGNLGPIQAATSALTGLANVVAFLDRQVARLSGGADPMEAAEIAVQRAQERVAEIQGRLARGGAASPVGRSNAGRVRERLRNELAQAEQEVVAAESRLRALIEERERERTEAAIRGAEERARIERDAAESAINNLRREVDKRVAIMEQFRQRMNVIERARRAGIPEAELTPLIRQAEKARDEALKALERREQPREERTRIDALKEQIALLEIVGERERFIAQEVMKAKAGQREEVERLAGALFDLKKAREEEEETARLAAQVYEQTRTPYEKYIETLERLARVREELAKRYGEEQAIQTIERASRTAFEILEKAEKQKERVDDVAKSLGLTFESAFENAIVKGEKFSNVLKSIEQDLLRLGTRKLVTEPLMGLFNSFLGGIFGGEGGGIGSLFSGIGSWLGGLFMHQGGLVGDKNVPRVLVNPALFAGAPRLHKGLMPDEFPAILQRGEMVIPRNVVEKARNDNATNRPINITVNVSGGPDTFRHSRGQIAAEMARELQRANRNL